MKGDEDFQSYSDLADLVLCIRARQNLVRAMDEKPEFHQHFFLTR